MPPQVGLAELSVVATQLEEGDIARMLAHPGFGFHDVVEGTEED